MDHGFEFFFFRSSGLSFDAFVTILMMRIFPCSSNERKKMNTFGFVDEP